MTNILRCEGMSRTEKAIIGANLIEIIKKFAPSLRRRNREEFNGRCPFVYHEDKAPSFGIHVSEGMKKGLWNCSCGSGNLIDFMKNITGLEMDQVIKILEKNQVSSNAIVHLENLINNWDRQDEEVEFSKLPKVKTVYSSLVKYLVEKRKRYTMEEAKKIVRVFNLGICVDYFNSPVYNWIIVPVKNKEGANIMWIAQNPNSRRKYNGGKIRGLVFNINNALKKDWVIVVESIWCAIRLTTWGFPAIATFGARMDRMQAALIKRHWKKVYLCYDMYDSDGKGEKAKKKAVQLLSPSVKLKTIDLGAKDADDSTLKEFKQAMANAATVK